MSRRASVTYPGYSLVEGSHFGYREIAAAPERVAEDNDFEEALEVYEGVITSTSGMTCAMDRASSQPKQYYSSTGQLG